MMKADDDLRQAMRHALDHGAAATDTEAALARFRSEPQGLQTPAPLRSRGSARRPYAAIGVAAALLVSLAVGAALISSRGSQTISVASQGNPVDSATPTSTPTTGHTFRTDLDLYDNELASHPDMSWAFPASEPPGATYVLLTDVNAKQLLSIQVVPGDLTFYICAQRPCAANTVALRDVQVGDTVFSVEYGTSSKQPDGPSAIELSDPQKAYWDAATFVPGRPDWLTDDLDPENWPGNHPTVTR